MALDELFHDGSEESLRILLDVLTHDDSLPGKYRDQASPREIRSLLVERLNTLTRQDDIDKVCRMWRPTKLLGYPIPCYYHDVLDALIAKHHWIASGPPELRVWTALRSGAPMAIIDTDPHSIAIVLEAQDRGNSAVRTAASQYLETLSVSQIMFGWVEAWAEWEREAEVGRGPRLHPPRFEEDLARLKEQLHSYAASPDELRDVASRLMALARRSGRVRLAWFHLLARVLPTHLQDALVDQMTDRTSPTELELELLSTLSCPAAAALLRDLHLTQIAAWGASWHQLHKMIEDLPPSPPVTRDELCKKFPHIGKYMDSLVGYGHIATADDVCYRLLSGVFPGELSEQVERAELLGDPVPHVRLSHCGGPPDEDYPYYTVEIVVRAASGGFFLGCYTSRKW